MPDAVTQYELMKPRFDQYAATLEQLVKTLLVQEGVLLQATEARSKSVDSFREKISRPGKNYSDPISDVTDLCGLRLILYHLDDLPRVTELIRREFIVLEDDSGDKGAQLGPQEFGYRSIHLVVRLGPTRAKLPEYLPFAGLIAEIQVRTVLQHAWAALDHTLRYKVSTDVPTAFRRRLFRLSGLLELADEEFTSLLRSRDESAREMVAALADRDSEVELNLDSLREFVASSRLSTRLMRLALQAGFDTDETTEYTIEEVSGPDADDEDLSHAVTLANASGASTIAAFESAIESLDAILPDFLLSLKQRGGGKDWIVSPEFVLLLAALLAFAPELEASELSDRGWSSDIARRVAAVVGQFATTR